MHADEANTKVAGCQIRVAIAMLAIIVALGFCSMVRDSVHKRHLSAMLEQATYKTVVVHDGTTLWQIAADNPLEGCSVDEQVAAICAVNELETAQLMAGMSLRVPVCG